METTKNATMEDVQAGSNLRAPVENAKPAPHAKDPNASAELSAVTFSTFFTWRGSGLAKLNLPDGRITVNSRVFVAISEYNTDPRQNRFVGDATMVVYNVSPHDGGAVVRFYVGWNGPLNVRFDVLVDPSWV